MPAGSRLHPDRRARDSADINFSSAAAWLFTGGLAALELVLVGLWLRFETAGRANALPAQAPTSPR